MNLTEVLMGILVTAVTEVAEVPPIKPPADPNVPIHQDYTQYSDSELRAGYAPVIRQAVRLLEEEEHPKEDYAKRLASGACYDEEDAKRRKRHQPYIDANCSKSWICRSYQADEEVYRRSDVRQARACLIEDKHPGTDQDKYFTYHEKDADAQGMVLAAIDTMGEKANLPEVQQRVKSMVCVDIKRASERMNLERNAGRCALGITCGIVKKNFQDMVIEDRQRARQCLLTGVTPSAQMKK